MIADALLTSDVAKVVLLAVLGLGLLAVPIFLVYGLPWPTKSLPPDTQSQAEKPRPKVAEPTLPLEPAKPPAASAASTTADADMGDSDIVLADALTAAETWEFNYLNLYLVMHTQAVLDWIALLKYVTAPRFHATWTPLIPSIVERAAVLNAILSHGLAAVKNDRMWITDKGERYLVHRGVYPYDEKIREYRDAIRENKDDDGGHVDGDEVRPPTADTQGGPPSPEAPSRPEK